MNAIEVKNLSKYYGKARGIVEVSFSVKEGEIFGFIGPNGSGKSTTIRTLLKLIKKNSGEASIFGMNIEIEHEKILKRIGYVPSEVNYYENMKVMELLLYSASFYKKDCREKIMEYSKILDLDLNKKIDELSFGNKKKVGIVQALIHEPDLLILDEPTSGLDPLIQQKFFEILEKENKRGMTIFLSSHVLSEVQKFCDRVAIIKDGKIIKIDTIENISNDNHKKVRLDVIDDIALTSLKMKEITNLKVSGKSCTFLYNGDTNKLIELASKMNLANITIEEPALEEVFMHYYDKVK